MRNLIELKFWAHFVSDSPAKATQFISEADIDAKELFDKMEKCVPPGTYQLGSVPGQGKRVSVEPSDAEEPLLWKMCSKLIHPSSWVINHPADTIHNDFQRRVLSTYVHYYGWGIVSIFHRLVWEE
jgi:hypothetical protein